MGSAVGSRPDWLEINAKAFGTALGRRPLTFRHRLGDHPLLRLDALGERADDWPDAWIEHHLADLPLLLPGGDVRRLPAGAGDVVRNLDHNGCWVVLWYLERAAAYRSLLDECLEQILPTVMTAEGRMGQRGANVFLGSPGATVPVHFDRHHNLLLQVQGTKQFMVGTFPDETTAQREIERHYGVSRNLEVLPPEVTTYQMGPGDGLYVPPYGFHWVLGGPEVSVALSCGFRSPRSERSEMVYSCNVKLRHLGFSPSPPGTSERTDQAKAAMVRTRRRILATPLETVVARAAGLARRFR